MHAKYDGFLQEQLQDPEFRKEFEALRSEHATIQAMINARRQPGITQKELSERTGIGRADIGKPEKRKR